MKRLRVVTCMTTAGVLVACAGVQRPPHPLQSWRQQVFLQSEYESGFNLNMHRAGMGTCVGLESGRRYVPGDQWRYLPSACSSNRSVSY